MGLRMWGKSNIVGKKGRRNLKSIENKDKKDHRRRLEGLRSHRNSVHFSHSGTSIYKFIYPMLSVIQVFGLAPYEIYNSHKSLRLQPSKFKCFYSIFCLTSYVCFVCYLVFEYSESHPTSPAISLVVIGKMLLNFFVLSVDLANELIQRKQFAHVCNTLANFVSCSNDPWQRFCRKLGLQLQTFILWSMFIWVLILIFCSIPFDMTLFSKTYHTLCYIASSFAICKPGIMLFAIGNRFAYLNKAARSIQLRSRKSVMIKKIEMSYIQLIDTSEKLNDIYSWPLFFFVFNNCCHIVINIYFILIWITYFTRTLLIISGLFAWLTIYFVQLLLLHVVCHYVYLKANCMPQILLDCRRHDERESKQNVPILETNLHFFNRRLMFTAGGCFKLDITLLTSICSHATTYLVILLQWSNEENTKGTQ